MKMNSKRKIIIHYDGDIDPKVAADLVTRVIYSGKESRASGYDQYCFLSTYADITVNATEKHREETDTFHVYRKH